MPEQPQTATPQARPKSKTKYIVIAIIGVLLFVWLAIGAVMLVVRVVSNEQSGTHGTVTQRQAVTNDGNTVQSSEESTVASVADKVSDSVVSVMTESTGRESYWGVQVQTGAGTGIIVDSNGYILTNKHVIDNARQVHVTLADGTSYDNVEVVATDPLNDLAYLKIPDARGLKAAQLGDSTTVRIGQQVTAIGNSLGMYQNTVTSGIISGTGRPVQAQNGQGSVETLTDLLQTDAAINPGNSGGPLLNAAGQVIGVNTAIVEDAQGIGFAIPINAAKGILKQVLAGSTNPQRAYLGVRFVPINAQTAKDYNLSVKQGAYVATENNQPGVVSGSPADKAGIRQGDVITKINDVEVGPRGGVSSLIAEYAPGDTVEITLLRGGDTSSVRVTLTSYR